MTVRAQEVHPAAGHFPIALFPTTAAFDVFGRLTDDRLLMITGKRLSPLAAAGVAFASEAGFGAQGAVRAKSPAHDHLVTHRTFNIRLTTLLATDRKQRKLPSPGYLIAGIAGNAAMAYSVCLRGKVVYGHEGDVREEVLLEIRRELASVAAQHRKRLG